jgi:hypothetical protein
LFIFGFIGFIDFISLIGFIVCISVISFIGFIAFISLDYLGVHFREKKSRVTNEQTDKRMRGVTMSLPELLIAPFQIVQCIFTSAFQYNCTN